MVSNQCRSPRTAEFNTAVVTSICSQADKENLQVPKAETTLIKARLARVVCPWLNKEQVPFIVPITNLTGMSNQLS